MKRIFLATIMISVLALQPAGAGVGASSGVDFLRLGGGARPLGMGEAYTALANDSSSVFYNPAGLSKLEFPQVLTMYNSWFADLKQQVAGLSYPSRFGVFALTYSGLNSGDIQGYDATGAVTNTFNTESYSLGLNFARRHNQFLSYGVGVKTISERLESAKASSVALDAGLTYAVNPQFNLGAAVLNLGSGLKFVTETTNLPTAYRLGASIGTTLFDEDANLAADLVAYPEGTKVNIGAEYIIRDFLSIRVGSAAGTLRAGLGIMANLFSFDYAYLSHADLGPTHQASLAILFGAPDRAKKLSLENLALGKAYLRDNKFSEAVIHLGRSIEYDPKNQEAQVLLDKARAELENEAFEKVFTERKVQTARTVSQIIESGKKFMDSKKYLEALGEFSNALKLEPTNREALKLQNEAQAKMESQLIEQSKTEARSYLGEAMKFVVTGKYQQASDQVNKALEKDPRNKQAQDLKKKLDLILKLEKR